MITGFRFRDVESATPATAFIEALQDEALRAVVLCPSNPFISMDPALALPGVRDALRATAAPVVAVSPVIGGEAVKGPTAKMMRELALPVTAATVADHYGDILDGFVIDGADEAEANDIAVPCLATRTLMRRDEDKQRLAMETLEFADALRDAR